MKKILFCVCLFIFSILLSGCFKISTPEDMLVPPELNQEKRETKEAVEKFRPINSSIYPIYYVDNNKTVTMITNDLDTDSNTEVISFYKNKIDDKIGMFVLRKVDSVWVKTFETTFNSYDLSNISIVDFNNDDKKEIVIESYENDNIVNYKNYTLIYFDNKYLKTIKEVPYIVMKIADIDKDGEKEIFSITRDTSVSNYTFNVDKFTGNSILNKKKKNIGNVETPYDMIIGNIFENKMAVFIDYINENKIKNSKVLIYDKKREIYEDMKDMSKLNSNYVFNVASKDIDGDGIIELAYKFKAPNYNVPIIDVDEIFLINGYFKVTSDYELELVREVYEDIEYSYIINFPNSFKGKYNLIHRGKGVDINYIDYLGKEYNLIKIEYIEKYLWQKDATLRESFQMITENQDYVIAGKVLDSSEKIQSDKKKQEYLKLRSEVIVLSNIIKEKNI